MAFLCDKCLEVLPENVLHCERCYPNGVVLFEGVTKEAHDKLKEQHALLAAENERLADWRSEMKGIIIHPLRLAAPDRMSVLRVPELWTWGYPMEVRKKA